MESQEQQRLQDCKRALLQKKEMIAEIAAELITPKSILLKLDLIFEEIMKTLTDVLLNRIADMDQTKHLKVLLKRAEEEVAKCIMELDSKERLELEQCEHFMNRASQLKYEIQALEKACKARKIEIKLDSESVKGVIHSALSIATENEVVDMKQEQEKQQICLIQPVENSAQLLLFHIADGFQKTVLTVPVTFPKHFAVEQLEEKVYIAGGRVKGYATNKFMSVNSKAEIKYYQNFETKRAYAALRKLKDSQLLLLSGGYSEQSVTKSCDLFDLSKENWKGFAYLK